MDTSVEAVDGDIVLKYKKFLVKEGENGISVSQNFIYAFADTVGERHGSNMGKAVIDLSIVEVPVAPAIGNNILLDSDILFDIGGKIWMQYVVSDPDPDVGYGKHKTMGVTLTASEKGGGCGPRIPS